MSGEEPGASTTPTNAMSPQELRKLGKSTGWAARMAAAPRWRASHPTGAFESAARSIRYMPNNYNWREVLTSIGVLYGVFVGLPAAAGAWSLWRIGQIVGWW